MNCGGTDDLPELAVADATEDRETLVGVIIETAAAIENLVEILTVPQLGFLFVGPLDLSVSLGYPREIDHPDMQEPDETVKSKDEIRMSPFLVSGLGWMMSIKSDERLPDAKPRKHGRGARGDRH